MGKVYTGIYKIVLIILGICFTYCFGMSVFGNMVVHDYKPIILCIGIFVYIGNICMLYQVCRKWTSKKLNWMIMVILIMYLILTLTFGLGIKSERPTDIFALHNAAASYLQTGEISDLDYFSCYPYQLNYTYVLIGVYKIGSLFGISDYRTSGTLFGTFLLFLSAVLVYKIADKIKGKYMGVISLIVFTTNPIFWIYSSYYYTDLIGMVFLLLIIDVALYINTTKNKTINGIMCFFLGVAIFTGYKFRATVAIGGIAVWLLSMVKMNRTKEKIRITYPIAVVFGCMITLLGYQIIENYFGIQLDKDKQFPVMHWVMMGLSEDRGGRWSGELWNYTNSFPTYAEKSLADIAEIKRSLSDMGALGIIRLLFDKLAMMWSDGMTALTINFQTSVHYGNLYEYAIGNKNAITCYLTQIMRSSLLLCMIPCFFYEIKYKFSKKSILSITVFGYMIFYFFWEVHEKYALMILPLLIVMAMQGIDASMESFREWRRVTFAFTGGGYKFGKHELFYLMKKMCLGIVILSIILYAIFWNNMIIKTDKKYNYVVYQSSVSDSILVQNNTIKQTFLTDLDFNAIYVRFYNNNVPKEQQYLFSLYDDSNTCVYQEEFSANDVADDTWHVFSFDDIQVVGYHEFYFEVTSIEQYEETISVCCAGNSYSDYYARGKCTVSDQYKGDLTFRIYYIESVSYYPKLFYIITAILVLTLEVSIYKFICGIVFSTQKRIENI